MYCRQGGEESLLCKEAGEAQALAPEARCLVQVLDLVSGFSGAVQAAHLQEELIPNKSTPPYRVLFPVHGIQLLANHKLIYVEISGNLTLQNAFKRPLSVLGVHFHFHPISVI